MPRVLLTCQRCSKKWDYSGKSTFFACCPNCKTSVSIRKQKERAVKGTKKTAFSSPQKKRG